VSLSAPAIRLENLWETPHSLRGRLATVDHKIVGKRYLVTAVALLLLGGLEALWLRLQLAQSGLRLVEAETYSQLFTMHGMTMIFWYASPVLSGFGNYLIPRRRSRS
jgi:heme/copper-type cytochrome/quinol oxidase subunit 1